MLRLLEMTEDVPALSKVPRDERDGCLSSIALLVTEARYHRLKFEWIVATGEARSTLIPSRYEVRDTVGRYAVFEAVALLSAARSAVDETIYLGARRTMSEDAAGKVNVTEALSKRRNRGTPDVVAELEILEKHGTWFDELNDYRNAFVHRTMQERFSYYSPAAKWAGASDLAANAMLIPDHASVRSKARRHRWTFNDRRRLEEIVRPLETGLFDFVDDVGTMLWGGTKPVDPHRSGILIIDHGENGGDAPGRIDI